MSAWHDDPIRVRFLSRIDIQADDCWLWTGSVGLRYGRFAAGDERWAHRSAWVLHTGESIPEGMHIHHMCVVPKCVNPAHLEALTVEQHQRRHPAKAGRPHGLAKRWVERCSCDVCMEAEREYSRERREIMRAEAAAGLREIPHGTLYGYTTLGCRCDECRRCQRENQRQRGNRTGMTRAEYDAQRVPEHGTTSMYTARKCRCELCRTNWNAYWREHRRRRREAA